MDFSGSAAEASRPLLARPGSQKEAPACVEAALSWCEEIKTLSYIAVPAILTSVFQYSTGSVTEILVGHIGTLELGAVGVQSLVVAGICFSILLGMGSALETLCGQAYGAGKPSMLGIYLQRSWIILLCTALLLTVVYALATPILKLLGQDDDIAEMAGRFSVWMIPELFAFALNFPIQRFLQAQSKVMAMTWISAAALALHLPLSWLFITKLRMGLVGAAITLNFSWVVLVGGQLLYVFSGRCRDTWTGFSWLAFADLWEFFVLSVASAIMLCLEYWTLMIVILLVGLLQNPEIAVDAASICMNVDGLCFMIPLGLLSAISVRVSNELGAGHPKAAKFSVLITVTISVIIQTIFVIIILLTRNDFPALFTDDKTVMEKVTSVSPYLALSIFLSSIQPVLTGLAVGAGWQVTVAYVNLGSYYVVGLTSSVLFGFKLNLGLEGIWGGVLIGMILQTIILIVITLMTDWDKEARLALERVTDWDDTSDGETQL